MRRGTFHLYKLNIIMGIILLLLTAMLIYRYFYQQEAYKVYAATEGEIVVIFKEEISSNSLMQILDPYGDAIKLESHIGDYVLLSVKELSDYERVQKELELNPLVKAVQENIDIKSFGFSNDPYADSQWAIHNPGYYITLSTTKKKEVPSMQGVDMDIVEAWESLKEKEAEKHEVVVAVIDTGVDYTHPDLAKHMWMNKGEIDGDGIDNDNNGYVDDIYGWDFYNDDPSVCHYEELSSRKHPLANPEDNDDHGTHIAGIIGAVADNNIGIAGIASNIEVRIMALKINGGKNGSGKISSSIEAIKYATMMGADICNVSWGTTLYTDTLEKIIKESDMLFVAAAGNDGVDNNDNPVYPASLELDNIISVAFIDSEGRLSRLSNYGNDTVDIAAPGEDIMSTVVGSYASMSGSSMAAPQVSGVAAILYAYTQNIYPAAVRQLLLDNIKPLPQLADEVIYPGIPSAYQAIKAYDTLATDTEVPTMSFETLYEGGDMIVPVHTEDLGGSKIRVVKWIFGEKTLQDFKRGIDGTTVDDNQIKVSKAGNYTFYIADYAGNEAVSSYEIIADTTVPKISSTYTVANNYKSRTITVRAGDVQSGVKRVKYMPGKMKVEDFLPSGAGTELEMVNEKGAFKVKKDGTYTIFASDNRGNLIVKYIVVKTIKATKVILNLSKNSIEAGQQFVLRAITIPANSTDNITYISSDELVARVSSSGKVTAVAPGKAIITVKTSSGHIVSCEVTVTAITEQ